MPAFLALLLAVTLAACGGNGSSGNGAGGSGGEGADGGAGGEGGMGGTGGTGGSQPKVDPFEPPSGPGAVPSPTEKGQPFGDPVTKVLGPDGGTIAYPDGPTLRIPAGALSEEIEVSIQLIDGTAPHRLGKSFEFGPDGTEFSTPVEVMFPFPAVVGNPGSEAGMGVAYQDEEGYWRAVPEVEVDTAEKVVVAKIDHFSSWTLFQQMELRPGFRSLRTGQVAGVWVYRCYQEAKNGLMLLPVCDGSTLHGAWAVNGVEGGSEVVGNLVPLSLGASYEAPAKVPSPNTVTVTAEVPLGKAKGLLFAQIEVVDGPCTYENPCEWEGTSYWELTMNGTATSNIRWVVDRKFPNEEIVRYRPEGTITYQAYDCTLSPDTFDIQTSTYRDEIPHLDIKYSVEPPSVRIDENIVGFPTSLFCGPDAHNRSSGHSDSVVIQYILSGQPVWDEDMTSFSRNFDVPDDVWSISDFRFWRR